MKSLNLKKFAIFALALVMAACLSVFTVLHFPSASAADQRTVTISGSTIFYASSGAEVWSHRDGDESDDYYTMFVLTEDSNSVNYRRNLAYEWFYNSSDDEEDVTAAQGLFHMEIGFESLSCEKFVIAFESQQYAATKDGKTANYLMIAAAEEEGMVRVLVTDNADDEVPEEDTEACTVVPEDHLTVSFAESESAGCYAIVLSYQTTTGEGEDEQTSTVSVTAGEFKNIGGTYSEYVSSTTKPVTPISFSAVFSGEEEDPSARMALYGMNGQSFQLTATPSQSDGHYVSGKVYDTAAPVLCLDSRLSYVGLGEEIDFGYTVIDVLASSPSGSYSYFMLTKEQAADNDFNPDDYTDDSLYRTVLDSDNQYMIPHADSYVPVAGDNYNSDVFDDDDFPVSAAVKICVKLTDTTATGGLSDYVLLDWYLDDDFAVTVNGSRYLAVAEDNVGPTYAYTAMVKAAIQNNNDDTEWSELIDPTNYQEWLDIVEAYQQAVTEAAEGLKAGSNNYIYLPDATSLFSDNCTSYEDLTFAVYYNNGSQQSSTGKSASSLSLNLAKATTYVFTIYVTDASGNAMYFYNPDYDAEKDDEDEMTATIATGNIWSMYTQDEDGDYADMKKYLPWFTFTVSAGELEIEDPDEQDIAFIDSTYSVNSFDINGINYTDTYALYYFNNDLYAAEFGAALSYDEFLSRKEELFTEYRRFFTYIYSTNDMESTDYEYEIYGDYEWDNTSGSLSFVPQDSGFYLIVCTVVSTTDNRPSVKAYMVISATEKVKALKGEDTWIQDNLTSIILLAIAGASLIGIILLLVIKPKDKRDLDDAELLDSAGQTKKKKGRRKLKN